MRLPRQNSRLFISSLSVLVLVLVGGCADFQDTSGAENTKVVERQHSEVWSSGNTSIIAELYAKDFVGHFPGGTVINGHDEIQATVEGHRSAFPDWNEEVEHIFVDGHFVISHFRSTGTHQGEFLGYEAIGNKIEITETCIYRMVDGKIAEQWVYPDIASLQAQLSSK